MHGSARIPTDGVDPAVVEAVEKGVTGFYEAGLKSLQQRFAAPL